MPSRQRYMSYSSSALPTLTVTNGHVELSYQPTKSRPHSQYISALDFDKNAYYMDDCASVGSSLSDDMADEHEIFVNLNSRAMAAIPMRLQNIMCEIQQERYDRLRQENPNLRVMPADYWIKPVEPVRKKPVRYNRAPTPLYLAIPPLADRRNAFQQTTNHAARGYPTLQSLGPGDRYRWAAHPGVVNHASRPTTAYSCSPTRSAQLLHERTAPAREFRVLNGYRQPVPPDLVLKQKLRKQHRRPSVLRSLSVTPVASNLRDRLKRSLSRLNKWMKNED
ncbi:hypothetical protein TMatcc_004281 [Talaromyces marneffei ATCC 18224]|uniref:UvrABC system protein B n=1 Tax=Talaromyces marneffei PM1 TaxID=1077442 RepID=A0A093VDM3_TALMA|nr:uncharacterized protein EYB26_000758 [Talaromyces marneffei]KAE8556870.1 hypothetical protein EYB25_001576 [Talaromyces marneffei]QGA13113.1 hypothetical protein EYB26_000758 [Talaromyces marneffei]